MYCSSQLSWTCYLVCKDWSTKRSSLDRNRCWAEHKSQHAACYWTIIFIFLFSQLLPACFLLAVCFPPWEIKWRIAKTRVLWRFPSSKLFPLILLWNRRIRHSQSNPCLEFWKYWVPVYVHWSTFLQETVLCCFVWIESYDFCIYFLIIDCVWIIPGCLKHFQQSTTCYSVCSGSLTSWNYYSNIIDRYHTDLRRSFIITSLSFTSC